MFVEIYEKFMLNNQIHANAITHISPVSSINDMNILINFTRKSEFIENQFDQFALIKSTIRAKNASEK